MLHLHRRYPYFESDGGGREGECKIFKRTMYTIRFIQHFYAFRQSSAEPNPLHGPCVYWQRLHVNKHFSRNTSTQQGTFLTVLGRCSTVSPIMATSGQSPSSSPRLPSPPPIAEDQIGPTSPGVSLFEEHGKFPNLNSIDAGAGRRIRPGTKSEDMAEGPPLVELQDVSACTITYELYLC